MHIKCGELPKMHKRGLKLYTLLEEIAEMFEKCIQNFLKHIFQGLPLWGVQTGVGA